MNHHEGSTTAPLRVAIHAEPALTASPNLGQPIWAVSIDIDAERLPESFTLRDPLTPVEKSECAWYLQGYAQQSPFSVTRAEKAAALVASYPRSIISQLELRKTVETRVTGGGKKSVLIEVSEGTVSADSTVHQLWWELLEDGKNWDPEGVSEIDIRLRRLLEHGDPQVAKEPGVPIRVHTWPSAADFQTVNVLMVVARDLSEGSASYRDISPFVSSGILSRIRSHLKEINSPVQLRLEIVRPGTFTALEEHLESTRDRLGTGYYAIVHFDMHGAVKMRKGTKTKAAYLYFDHPQENRKVAVDADRVGRLLQTHQVEIAVLNACESARANAGDDANIAKVFYRHGVYNVLAMSFKVSSHAAEIFLGSFYHSLLVLGQPFWQAAATARVASRESPTRHARFGLDVSVTDWFIPVTYSSGVDIQVVQHENDKPTEQDASCYPKISPAHIDGDGPSQVFGREFDLLRLEKAIAHHGRVYLHGPAGVGKTALLQFGCTLWRETFFTSAVVYLDFDSAELQTAGAVLKHILRQLLAHGGDPKLGARFWTLESQELESWDIESLEQAVVEILADQTVLLVLDNLHAAFSILPPPLCPGALPEKNAQDIGDILQRLFEPSNVPSANHRIVLAGSRDDLSFLKPNFSTWNDVRPIQLRPLDLAAGMELVQHVIRRSGLLTAAPNHADLDTMELLVSLLDGMPAAIHEVL
ncbi:hypothetical protein B0T24DRAFT_531291, partial [Lasiosphaeria ovina]